MTFTFLISALSSQELNWRGFQNWSGFFLYPDAQHHIPNKIVQSAIYISKTVIFCGMACSKKKWVNTNNIVPRCVYKYKSMIWVDMLSTSHSHCNLAETQKGELMSMPQNLRPFSLFSSSYKLTLIFSISLLLIASIEVALEKPAQLNPSNPNLTQCLTILVGGRL